MKLLVFFFVAVSIAFLVTEACSPSPSGGASSGGPSTGASSTISATSTTTKEESAARKRRAVLSEESVSAAVHTKIAFEDEAQAKEVADQIGDQLEYVVDQSNLDVEKIHKSVANVDGNVAILYRLKGEEICKEVMTIADIGVTYIDIIAKIEINCKDDQKKVFKKQ
ncbi:hypothetical protein QR680_004344 [Steinernema hermaphroditum]|uniref:Cystatin domain-containing protein n=1 Tax=Steinernema hermaphroditum TaxID=289476 RepID=A0AA39HPF9_9BILA|nr:hypothetical protein QR680_004344 [Steinernema hermaphroditum]